MTQSSLAVSRDGQDWALLNTSPDIGVQLQRTPQLHPRGLRDSPIKAVVLTNGDIDHIAGLLTLREKTAFDLYATAAGLRIIEDNAVFQVLDPSLVSRCAMMLDTAIEPLRGLRITPFAVPGKIPLFQEGEDAPDLATMGEMTIGLVLEAGERRVAYIPGCAALPDWLLETLHDVDLVLFDGTVWDDADMQRAGTGLKTGQRMGHIALNGPAGTLERCRDLTARKILVHINNTNPVLQPNSDARARVRAAGWGVAYDGMELSL